MEVKDEKRTIRLVSGVLSDKLDDLVFYFVMSQVLDAFTTSSDRPSEQSDIRQRGRVTV